MASSWQSRSKSWETWRPLSQDYRKCKNHSYFPARYSLSPEYNSVWLCNPGSNKFVETTIRLNLPVQIFQAGAGVRRGDEEDPAAVLPKSWESPYKPRSWNHRGHQGDTWRAIWLLPGPPISRTGHCHPHTLQRPGVPDNSETRPSSENSL